VDPDLRRWKYLVGTYEPYRTRLSLHLDMFVLMHSRI
jgi:hypothetical protein